MAEADTKIKPAVKPFVLIILDGWGVGSKNATNAIYLARTPHYDSYAKRFPYSELYASSVHVGLHEGQDGNSEAGHLNIGAGRVVEQDSVLISRAISDGTFFKNPALIQAAKHAKKHNSAVHLMGLLSNGQSAHSHPDHIIALITFFNYQKVKKIFLHLFTDGRDSHRYSAINLLRKYQTILSSNCTIASIIGRAYAMDRKKDWQHTKLAYEAIVKGNGIKYASSAEDAVLQAYNRGETDEFILPTVITAGKKPIGIMRNNESIVFFNLRSDRARQLAKPFVQTRFENENQGAFKRTKILKNVFFVALADFGPDLDSILTAYPSRDIIETLPFVLKDLRQLYIAESEKYAHITYFFNGGYAKPVAGEDRVVIPSPHVLSYVNHPKMSLAPVTKYVVGAIKKNSHDFIAMNVSNADMIAHTGSINATVAALNFVDTCLGVIVDCVLEKGGIVCITSDHGNAEELISHRTGEVDTEHSKNLVPFILIKKGLRIRLRKKGKLADIAPTILDVLKIPQPKLMTGKSLIE